MLVGPLHDLRNHTIHATVDSVVARMSWTPIRTLALGSDSFARPMVANRTCAMTTVVMARVVARCGRTANQPLSSESMRFVQLESSEEQELQ